jgi:hypothetical protein
MALTLKLAAIDDLDHPRERRGKAGWVGKARITVSSSPPVGEMSFLVPFGPAATLEDGIRTAMQKLADWGRDLHDEASRAAHTSAAKPPEEQE